LPYWATSDNLVITPILAQPDLADYNTTSLLPAPRADAGEQTALAPLTHSPGMAE